MRSITEQIEIVKDYLYHSLNAAETAKKYGLCEGHVYRLTRKLRNKIEGAGNGTQKEKD